MQKISMLLAGLLLVSSSIHGQCETCTPDPECISEVAFPTICPLILPDATAGMAYETVLTFFLPAIIVDPDTEIEASLDEVIITNVSGLPFGMEYSINSEDNTYYPGEGEEQGCATLCGTPILAGSYDVTITVHVTVTAFGFEQELDESFQLPLTVLPGQGGNTTFTVDNLAACGELSVQCEALIDGSPGITNYFWDFGNGNTSEESTPPVQVYAEPGNYTISLHTEIQDFTLQSVAVYSLADGWGGDIEDGFGLLNPDPYFVITDGDGVAVYTAPFITDVTSGSWDSIDLILNNPPYSITFWDSDDLITEDDYLGTSTFELTAGNTLINAEGTSASMEILLQTTSEFEEYEEVTVFESPMPELVFDEESSLLSVGPVAYITYLWTDQEDTLSGENNAFLELEYPGEYQCTVTNEFGCTGSTELFQYCPDIVLAFNENTQELSAGGNYQNYTWYFNGLPIEGAVGSILLADTPGNYSVIASTEFGCEVSSEVITINVGIDKVAKPMFTVFPNPVSNILHITGSFAQETQLAVFTLDGQLQMEQPVNAGARSINLDVHELATGVYLVQIQGKNMLEQHRIIVIH